MANQVVQTSSPPLKKWKFLAAKQAEDATHVSTAPESAQFEISKYLIEIRNTSAVDHAMDFWLNRRQVYPKLSPLAEDLIAAPASQAFVERTFSVCGLLTAGRRNRMETSLETKVFLKLNAHLVDK